MELLFGQELNGLFAYLSPGKCLMSTCLHVCLPSIGLLSFPCVATVSLFLLHFTTNVDIHLSFYQKIQKTGVEPETLQTMRMTWATKKKRIPVVEIMTGVRTTFLQEKQSTT